MQPGSFRADLKVLKTNTIIALVDSSNRSSGASSLPEGPALFKKRWLSQSEDEQEVIELDLADWSLLDTKEKMLLLIEKIG